MIDEEEIDEWCERVGEGFKKFHNSEPNKPGIIELSCPIAPVSFQRSNRREKDLIKKCIQTQTNKLPWIVSDDVQVEIEWKINDRNRYESPGSPDADNIIKPILDSLVGFEGILLDDCQVNDVRSFCSGGWVSGHNRFDMKIHLPSSCNWPTHFIKKEGLHIVHLKHGLCVPIDKTSNHQTEAMVLKQFEIYLEHRTSDDFDQNLMPFRRIFHKSRVSNYPIVELSKISSVLKIT